VLTLGQWLIGVHTLWALCFQTLSSYLEMQ